MSIGAIAAITIDKGGVLFPLTAIPDMHGG